MPRIEWDKVSERLYETGVKNAVLYPFNTTTKAYDNGVAWNGITGITETPSGAEATALYADNIKYLNLISTETFAATIQAYMYPDEFAILDGTAAVATGVTIGQQKRGTFGLSYRTELGNDTENNDYGYKLHIIYGGVATPSEKAYNTINESPEAITFSWTVNTTPVDVPGFKPTATLTIDSTKVDETKLNELLDILYGTTGTISYEAVASPEGNPSENEYYERSVSAGSYVYTLSTDTTVESGKTYYSKVETGGTTPSLPLPDDIAKHFGAQG